MNRVQIVLKAVMLRRQKTSEVDGKPILNLPPKHIEMDNVEFSDDELSLYKALETKSQIQFNKYLKNNTMSCKRSRDDEELSVLMTNSQLCIHSGSPTSSAPSLLPPSLD
jgi:SNF2 family DNA or RNA helicase